MPPANPRKRQAPGSPAPAQNMQQTYNAPTQAQNTDYIRWGQGPENANFTDLTGFNMNNYNGSAISPNQYDSSVPALSTQLARRPYNQHLVKTANRSAYDNSADPWGPFGNDALLDTKEEMSEEDNVDFLEEKANIAKRDAQSKRKQIPPFVQKLSSFLDESKNTELIRWSERGNSFVVLDEDEFAKTLIPELFKHNNYASFVRQLNMYGFHKRVGLSDNSMKASERKNKSPSEYYNPYFKRGHPNLLWLINKAKGGSAKTGRGKKVKTEGEQDVESDEDRDVDETFPPSYGNNVQGTRAISQAPESGPLQRREMAVVQNQVAELQKQQGAISQAIARLRRDHNQLYQQAVAFQTLHDRHESSINAILTFLATVYNRSLDGQGPQNIAQMFANGIPHDQQQPNQGNVVDMEDLSNLRQASPGNMSPHRRQQRLLMAPPNEGGRANTMSPASSTPRAQSNTPHAVEELFDHLPESSHSKKEPQQNMMDLINTTNANARTGGDSQHMEFPEMLQHYENSNGHSPLTTQQRNNMLSMIADQTSAPGSNNALISPSPPVGPSLEALDYTQAEIDGLMAMQHEQDKKIRELRQSVEPLSPSGNIPGLGDGSYFNGNELGDPSNSNLDLDQFLDTGAFYNGSSPLGGNGEYKYDYGEYPDGVLADSHFDMGMEGTNDIDTGRIVETTNSSEVNTPETAAEDNTQNESIRSPTKRRRKN